MFSYHFKKTSRFTSHSCGKMHLFLVEPHFDMFARCKVNGTTFSSQFNRTERGSTILAYCVDRDIQGVDRVSSYFAQVMFFFSATARFNEFPALKFPAI